MKSVFNRMELIAIVKGNREAHIREYVAAVTAYHRRLSDRLATAMNEVGVSLKLDQSTPVTSEAVEKIRPVSLKALHNLPVPQLYVREYDSALRRLMNDVRQDVELDERDCQQLLDDKWDFTHRFKVTNSAYGIGSPSDEPNF